VWANSPALPRHLPRLCWTACLPARPTTRKRFNGSLRFVAALHTESPNSVLALTDARSLTSLQKVLSVKESKTVFLDTLQAASLLNVNLSEFVGKVRPGLARALSLDIFCYSPICLLLWRYVASNVPGKGPIRAEIRGRNVCFCSRRQPARSFDGSFCLFVLLTKPNQLVQRKLLSNKVAGLYAEDLQEKVGLTKIACVRLCARDRFPCFPPHRLRASCWSL
jgi:hypothetical protein